jgi:LysM repeat protein
MKGRVVYVLCLASLLLGAAALFAGDSTYTIKEGETLFAVARRLQVPVDVLSKLNGIADTGKVKAGTVLRIPIVYAVKKGDTLYGIARAHSVSLARLLDANNLDENAKLKVGEKIVIPGAGGTGSIIASQSSGSSTPQSGALGGGAGAADSTQRVAESFVWPLPGKREQENGKLPGLVFYGASGDLVHSATAGEVVWAATFWGQGKIIIVRQADGTHLTYRGNREILVNVGDRVSPGTEIARLGDSPEGGGVRLHLSIKDAHGRIVDPEKYFSAKS